MSEENMKQYRAEEKLDTWWVMEWPDNVIATFTDSKTSSAEEAAKEYAEKMNAAYGKSNYDKYNESISDAWFAAHSLEYWSEALFKKMHIGKYTDIEPRSSVAITLAKMRESLKRAESAINSISSAEDVEKAIKEHGKS